MMDAKKDHSIFIVQEKHGNKWVPTQHPLMGNLKAAKSMLQVIKVEGLPGTRIVEYDPGTIIK